MKKTIYPLAMVLAGATALAAVPASPVLAKVSVTQVASPALVPGSTYAWAPQNRAMMDSVNPTIANTMTEAMLRSAIESSLAQHGYRKAAEGAPADLTVSYLVVLEDMREAQVSGNGANWCNRFGCFQRGATGATVTEKAYTQGTIILDLAEASTGQLVWRASSDKRVKPSDVSQSKLNSVIKKMTKSLPSL